MTKATSYRLRSNPKLLYVIVDDLPDDQRESFVAWLKEQKRPEIEDKGSYADCAYAWDYDLWFDYWCKGEEAPISELDEETLNPAQDLLDEV